jgi:ATP-dependent protease ClpP protease subunit
MKYNLFDTTSEGEPTSETTKPQAQETTSSDADRVNPLTINFYSPVTTESCVMLSSMLKNLDVKSKELEFIYDYRVPIKLHIQSLGGELMPTFYICDLIQNMDTPVHVYIDGYVASAASVIAVCGEKRFMTKHSSILIHQLKSSSAGKFNEMKDEMSNLNFFMNMVKEIYLKNSDIHEDELEELLKSDIWLPAERCLSLGLVDRII